MGRERTNWGTFFLSTIAEIYVGLQWLAEIWLYCSDPVNKIHADGSCEQMNPTPTSTEFIRSPHKQAHLLKRALNHVIISKMGEVPTKH